MFMILKVGMILFVTAGCFVRRDLCFPVEGDGDPIDDTDDDFGHLSEILRKRSSTLRSIEDVDSVGKNKLDAMEYILKANQDINRNSGNLNGALFEGDIYVSSAKEQRNAVKDANKIWPGGVIYYRLDKNFVKEDKRYIKTAMANYEELTCLQFRKRQTEKDYVYLSPTSGCWSEIGLQGGRQDISLGEGCSNNTGIIMHELMHTAGFWHEQSRTDRDEYITIVWDNMWSYWEKNFDSYSQKKIDDLGSPYDYGSIMHYPANAFSKNEKVLDTIIPKVNIAGSAMGQRNFPSEVDLYKINKLYNCVDHLKQLKPKSTGDCVDNDESCMDWANNGECQTHPPYMLDNCRKSCAECESSVVPPDCMDHDDQCVEWAKDGDCAKNPAYMHSSCKKSCGKCASITACVDENELCEWWAAESECSKNAEFMNLNCKKSCNKC